MLKKAILKLCKIGIIPLIIVVTISPFIFPIILGEEWGTSGIYASWLSIWLYTFFITRPVISAIRILNLHNFHLKFEIISLTIKTLSLCMGGLFLSDIYTVAIYSLVSGLLYISLLFYVLNKSGN